MRRGLGWPVAVLPALALGMVGAAGSAEPAAPSIAVVAFAGQGAEVPDVAAELAERIRAEQLGAILGPGDAGTALSADVDSAEIRQRAESLGVDALIVGSTEQRAEGTRIDFRLHLAESPMALATYVAEVTSPDQLEHALDRLAQEVAAAARTALAPPPLPEVSAPKRSPGDVGGLARSDAPISITAEEMEAYQNEGSRRFVFLRNVRVTQDDVTLTSDRLEAFYPDSSNQPDRLVATGSVRVMQRGRQASCDEATYLRATDRVVCRGSAELREGCDRIRGRVIEFDLTKEYLVVSGAASAVLHSGSDEGAACPEPSS